MRGLGNRSIRIGMGLLHSIGQVDVLGAAWTWLGGVGWLLGSRARRDLGVNQRAQFVVGIGHSRFINPVRLLVLVQRIYGRAQATAALVAVGRLTGKRAGEVQLLLGINSFAAFVIV